MKVNWKSTFGLIRKGLGIGAQFDPRLAAIDNLITHVEEATSGEGKGKTKHETVVLMSNAVIESALLRLSPERQQALLEARDAYINAVVAYENVKAETVQLAAAFKAHLDAGDAVPGAPDPL